MVLDLKFEVSWRTKPRELYTIRHFRCVISVHQKERCYIIPSIDSSSSRPPSFCPLVLSSSDLKPSSHRRDSSLAVRASQHLLYFYASPLNQ